MSSKARISLREPETAHKQFAFGRELRECACAFVVLALLTHDFAIQRTRIVECGGPSGPGNVQKEARLWAAHGFLLPAPRAVIDAPRDINYRRDEKCS